MRRLLIGLVFILILSMGAMANLSTSDSTLAMGEEKPGSSLEQNLTLSNSATSSVTLSFGTVMFSSSSAQFSAQPTSSVSELTASASNVNVPINVAIPSSAAVGSYTGDLVVSDASDQTNNVTLPITLTVSTARQVTTGDVTIAIDYSELDEDEEALNFTKTVTVSNTGVYDETVTLALDNVDSDDLIEIDTQTFSLSAGSTKTVTFEGYVQDSYDSGTTKIGDIVTTFNNGQSTDTKELFIEVESMLEISDLDVEIGDNRGDTNLDDGDTVEDEAAPGDKVVFIFEVSNKYNDDYDDGDIDDVELNIELEEDDFGDDIDEDADSFDVKAGDEKDEITIEFEVPEDAEEGTYDFEITLEGKADSGSTHTQKIIIGIEVERERDDVRITRAELLTPTLSCQDRTTLLLEVKNFGSRDQDDVMVRVQNTELNLNRVFNLELDEGGDRNDDWDERVEVIVPDSVSPGTYRIDSRVFIEGDELEDQEDAVLTIEKCALDEPEEEEEEEEENDTVQPPVSPPAQNGDTTLPPATNDTGEIIETVERPFTSSPLFIVILLLANLLIIGVIVAVLIKFMK